MNNIRNLSYTTQVLAITTALRHDQETIVKLSIKCAELKSENFRLRELIEGELHLSNFGIDAVLRERIAGNKRELR